MLIRNKLVIDLKDKSTVKTRKYMGRHLQHINGGICAPLAVEEEMLVHMYESGTS